MILTAGLQLHPLSPAAYGGSIVNRRSLRSATTLRERGCHRQRPKGGVGVLGHRNRSKQVALRQARLGDLAVHGARHIRVPRFDPSSGEACEK